ncbi:hypothetical protein D3C72_60750 [compost metagenome]
MDVAETVQRRREQRQEAAPGPELPEKKDHSERVFTGLIIVVFLAYGLISGWHYVHRDYFVPLAEALLQGHLDVGRLPGHYNELVPSNGKWYVVFPFMPALLVMPWVLVAKGTANQLWACLFFGSLNAALVLDIVRHFGQPLRRALLFAILFAFGTVHWYGASDGGAWHFAQVTALTFLFLAIREIPTGGRPWRMGMWLGMAMLCRLDTVMAFPFFLAFFLHRSKQEPGVPLLREEAGQDSTRRFPRDMRAWWQQYDPRRFALGTLEFGGTLSVFAGLYLLYNALRFGSPLITGYSLIPGLLEEPWYRDGFMSLSSIPRNLYTLLFKAPAFSEGFPYIRPYHVGGLSLLMTTPAFLWAIKARGWNWLSVGSWLAVVGIALPILLHGDIGGAQFGYRYAMDFYPFLLLLMIRGMGDRLTFEQGLAIGLSLLVNAWGIWACVTGNWA